MPNIFLIFGYGIPKNILKDENYNFYLKTIFNKIYNFTLPNKITKPLLIFCGGKTDMFRPYLRNEAEEMIRFFMAIIKQRPFLKMIAKNWVLTAEKESLSTLENLLNSQKIIAKRKIKKARVVIFCEHTRARRIKILAHKIFAHTNISPRIEPVDFDMSANRYLPLEFLRKKERSALKSELLALRDAENLKKHHAFFEEKLRRFRKAGPKAHVAEIKKWWEENLVFNV